MVKFSEDIRAMGYGNRNGNGNGNGIGIGIGLEMKTMILQTSDSVQYDRLNDTIEYIILSYV